MTFDILRIVLICYIFAKDMVNEVDKDGTGSIDFPEFLTMMSLKINEENAEEELREAFKVFDGDGNGFIDRRELGLMMRFMGETLTEGEIQVGAVIELFYDVKIFIKMIIEEADSNKDGLIDYNEFYKMMQPMSK